MRHSLQKRFLLFLSVCLIHCWLGFGAHCRRMIGKELDGMGYFELFLFRVEILHGMLKAEDMKKIKRAMPVNKVKNYIIILSLLLHLTIFFFFFTKEQISPVQI